MNNDVPRGKVEGLPVWGADIRVLPSGAPKKLVDAYRAIEIACLEIERSVAILHVLRMQKGNFVTIINESHLPRIMTTLNSSLTRDLIVSVSRLFDDDCRSTHIRRAAEVVISCEYSDILLLNSLEKGTVQAEWMARKLKLQRFINRIKNDKYRDSLKKIRKFRQQKVAHFNTRPIIQEAIYLDIENLLLISSQLIKYCCLYVEGKYIPIDSLSRRAMCDAQRLIDCIHTGIARTSAK